MNGAIPPNNNRNWLAHANECTSTSKNLHQDEDSFSVRATYQRDEQTLCTNILTGYQFTQPSTSSAKQTAVLNALQPQDTIYINHNNIKNNCSEICIELLIGEAWGLDPEFYKNNHQIDILKGLYLAGEISSQIHIENPAHQGILVSYDGYSETKLTAFIKNKLDIFKNYIIRTGKADANGWHFAICYFEPSNDGWIIEDKLFGLNQLTDTTGALTTFGHELLAPYADWGPSDEQHSIVFIEATPRRIAILSEYLLRYRYYGEIAASTTMHEFDRSTGVFPQRPANTYSFMFPNPLTVPIDAEATQYAETAAINSASYFVPYENRSVERTLMALAGNQSSFNVTYHDALNSYPIDLVGVLIKANELNSEGVFNPKKGRDDCYIDTPHSLSHFLQKLNKTKPFFLRLGINNGLGHYFALKYFDESFTYPSGWYYYGRQNEMQSDDQTQSVDWFLLADTTGALTTEGNLICLPQNIIWGSGTNDFSLQFIEATEARQHILQKYVSYLRHISNKAAFAVLDQHAQARIREIAEDELAAEQLALNPQSVKFSSFLAQSNSEDLLNDLSTIIEQENYKSQSISQTLINEDSLAPERQKHIAFLNEAIKNPKESKLDRVKFTAIKMMLQNVSDYQIVKYCKGCGTSNASWNEAKLRRMKEYYRHGGLLLLRGFSMTSNSSPPAAEIMQEFMKILENNVSWGSTKILNKLFDSANLREKIEELPVQSVLDDFIKRCGYARKKITEFKYIWSFNTGLTQGISTENLLFPSSRDRQQLEEQASQNARKRKIKYELTHHQRQRQETRKIRKTVDPNGILVLSGENKLKLQTDELTKAISSDEERVVDKLKFQVVRSSLEGKSTENVRNDCYELAQKLNTKKIKVTDETVRLMVQHYKVGGLTLLKGYALISALPREQHSDLTIKKYILDLIDDEPRFSIGAIQAKIATLKVLSRLTKVSIPDCKVINSFLVRCGYKWNSEFKKWE